MVLLSLFAVQHSVMARKGFKQWWTRIVVREHGPAYEEYRRRVPMLLPAAGKGQAPAAE